MLSGNSPMHRSNLQLCLGALLKEQITKPTHLFATKLDDDDREIIGCSLIPCSTKDERQKALGRRPVDLIHIKKFGILAD